ncbi:MAG: thioredoxin peroxidase [Candidatus Omnitrophica bacterium CG11_big_fil_rev_8_21_14_0_20_45_26]|uniref:Thioredoxin peroxidase n=1 Tax=Candidatus Abzuiibacterium crystallinum TaxID=1974748 RepID=A0A2H0LM30_9BACT|nr:MAG: thioredoxin peroxidase [Candidatus Omnitrophica bacterium CG11_big_fil_rev_8_21_14_0_20_45_26]PIW63670.1 MAG: thioredoxin peroxidase [Candidatus Omnitrophica bacterium CG12_big_fil_rev_8_21_14_0_65_45_16]
MSTQVGTPAPDFTMQAVVDGGKFQPIKLSDYKGKWVVLFFYPLDFTFVCPTEITSFRDKLKDFNGLNAVVIGASIDSVYSHQAWIKQQLGELGFPLASDISKEVSRRYGILLEDKGIALRGTFIIDPNGILRWYLVNDLGIGRNIDEVVRVLKALQTGELCQANWKPGEKTLGKA